MLTLHYPGTEIQSFCIPVSRLSRDKPRFLSVDFPRWYTTTSGEKNSNTNFTRTPAGISWRTLCYLMISRTSLGTTSPWNFSYLSLQGRSCFAFVYSQIYDVYPASWDSSVPLKLPFYSINFSPSCAEIWGSIFLFFINSWHLSLTLKKNGSRLILATISKSSKGVLRI